MPWHFDYREGGIEADILLTGVNAAETISK